MLLDIHTLTRQLLNHCAENNVDGQHAHADSTSHTALFPVKLKEVTDLLEPAKSVHWMSNGNWSMHELLGALLQKTGPADVYISSYAFSELPARSVATWKNNGSIKRLYCLLDSRIDVRSASALTLVQNTADACKLCATHAKVTLLINDRWKLAVVGSANYTTNKRYECGLICADPSIVLFHQTWIEHELHKA